MIRNDLLKILFVEDLPSDSELAVRELRREGLRFEHIRVDTRDEFIKALNEFKPDIVISDYMMPSYNGMLALIDAREYDQSMPFILCTGSMNEETAVECIKAGATDYVIKEHLTRLPFAVKEALDQNVKEKEKRAAEIALHESEERFRILYNDAVVGLYRTNLQGEIFLANKTLVNMLGFQSFEELALRNLKESGYGPTYQRQEFIDQIEKSGEVKDLETVWICRDGEEIFVRESAKAFYDSDGKIIYYDGTVQNITEQKKTSEALNKIQHLFETLARVSPVGIFRTDRDGNTTYINPRYSELAGLSFEEAMGRGWFNAVHPADKEKIKKSWLKDFTSKKVSSSEYRFLKPDGSIVWVMGNAVPELINNEIVGYIGTITDITEIKGAEDKLKSSEERFKILFDYAPDAYYLNDLKGSFIDGNIAAEKLLGLNKNELIGKSFLKLNLLSLKQLPRAAKLLVKNSLGQSTGPDEFVLSRIDGSQITIEIITHPVKIKGQTLVLGLARDISGRKLAEEKVINERKMLRTMIDNLPDAICVKDIDCRKVIANKADVKNIGFKKEAEILGKTDIELFPGHVGQRGYVDDKNVINSGIAIVEHEEDFVDSKGVRHWVLTTKIPLHDNNGKIIGLVGIGHDVTDRKRAEAELLQSYEFNESLLKTIPFGMDIVDETGTVLFQSDNFKRLFGEEAIGSKCWELYRDDKTQCSDCPLFKGITIGETMTYESNRVLENRIFEINHTGMMYQGRKAMLKIFQDITERKENEQNLIKAKEQAEESDRLKSAFLTNMSHEIRTPMNGILGFTELLKEPNLTSDDLQDYIQTIQISGSRMLNTINNIVDISKIESGLMTVEIIESNINEKIDFIYKFFKPEAEIKKLQFFIKYGLKSKDAAILTDNEKVYAILTNLVKNAIKFTYDGFIELGYEKKGEYLEFFVKDTGIGIPLKQREMIFERFRQGSESHNRGYEGSGLGLSISRSYIKMLGGEIWVESEEGIGSTFYFTIPYNPVSEEILDFIPSEQNEVPLESLKILIVEDDEISHSLLTRNLQKTKCEIIHAITGLEAVEACRNNPDLDLILMDIRMPQMDGNEATRQIRQFNPNVTIIAQTAYAFSGDSEKAIAAGCNAYISKPINMTLLNDLIKKHCKKYK